MLSNVTTLSSRQLSLSPTNVRMYASVAQLNERLMYALIQNVLSYVTLKK
jgi:hypothetical protein